MAEVCTLDWHIAPLRADRWLDVWEPVAAKCTAYGARSWSLTRSTEDPLKFQQTMLWDNRSDFERYWYSDEVRQAREQTIGYYDILLLPEWHTLLGSQTERPLNV
ncbi:MAG: hypothetical protein JST31_16820 [Actinobacteria bacterium]|nr:hypothetical protein [Actinomycetota bacterium]